MLVRSSPITPVPVSAAAITVDTRSGAIEGADQPLTEGPGVIPCIAGTRLVPKKETLEILEG